MENINSSVLKYKAHLCNKQIDSYLSQYFNLTNEITELASLPQDESNFEEISFLQERVLVVKGRLNAFNSTYKEFLSEKH